MLSPATRGRCGASPPGDPRLPSEGPRRRYRWADAKGNLRRRRLLALVALLGAGAMLIVVVSSGSGGGSGSEPAAATGSGAAQSSRAPKPHLRLIARASPAELPAPISGETIVSRPAGLVVIGGLDSAAVSTSSVLEFEPGSGTIRSPGSLSQPLHDAASAAVNGGVLIFGGGSATTIDEVERLAPGRAGEVIGRMPQTRSDLSALTVGGSAIVLGGYDGVRPVGSVLETEDGRSFNTLARLPVAVRYASVAARGKTVYVLGGELADGTDASAIQAVDLASGKAEIVGYLPGGLSHASAVSLRGRILLLGGRLAGQTTDQILRFDPRRARAKEVGRLPAPVQNAAAGVVAGAGYLVGGLDSRGAPLTTIVVVHLTPLAAPAGAG